MVNIAKRTPQENSVYAGMAEWRKIYRAMHPFWYMLTEEISLGMRVRYPKTGTTGTVMHLEQIKGSIFAELDSTNLLYRIDQLIPAERAEKTNKTLVEDAKIVIEREREFAAGNELQEAWKNIDQSCEGGG